MDKGEINRAKDNERKCLEKRSTRQGRSTRVAFRGDSIPGTLKTDRLSKQYGNRIEPETHLTRLTVIPWEEQPGQQKGDHKETDQSEKGKEAYSDPPVINPEKPETGSGKNNVPRDRKHKGEGTTEDEG